MNCGEADGCLDFLMRECVAKGIEEFQIHLKNCSECRELFADVLLLKAVEKITREEWEDAYRGNKEQSTGYTD
jgi:predicted anti-sigma-YlaC factor YlaD